jgi:uncharacterized metal-binding protein YceD (DUF177 family)
MKSKDDSIKAQISVSKTPLNNWNEYHLTESIDWVAELLAEMSEHASSFTSKMLAPKAYLHIDLKINKKFKSTTGEMLLIQGSLDALYPTECVKSLKPLLEPLQFEFKGCFLNKSLETDEQYAEVDEVFEENDIYQVYFYQKNMADLKEMIHEQIYLNYNSYPMSDAEKQLLSSSPSDESNSSS